MIKQAEQILGLFPNSRTNVVLETAIDDFYADLQDKYFTDYKRICAYIEKCVKDDCEYMPTISKLTKFRDDAVAAVRQSRQSRVREKKYPNCKHCRNSGLVRYHRVYNEPKQSGGYECYPFQTVAKWRTQDAERLAKAYRQGRIYDHVARCFCEKGQTKDVVFGDILNIFPEFRENPEWNYHLGVDLNKKLSPEEREKLLKEAMATLKTWGADRREVCNDLKSPGV